MSWLKSDMSLKIASLVLAFFVWWRYQIPNRQDENYEEFVTAGHFFPDVITRIPEFGGPILKQTFLTWDRWMGFWWIAIPLLLVGWGIFRGRRAALSWPLLLGFAAPLLLAWGAYTVHWAPDYLVTVTWERFLIWLVIGLVVYATYGRRHSRLAAPRP